MRTLLLVLAALLAVGMLPSPGQALVVDLKEIGYWSGGQPMGTDSSAFDPGTGLGTIRQTITGVGVYYVGLYLDQDLDEASNSFFNEYGATSGAPAAARPGRLTNQNMCTVISTRISMRNCWTIRTGFPPRRLMTSPRRWPGISSW